MGEFDGAGQNTGIEVWRIEKMVPTPIAKEDHGTFYSGDSYIVLSTKQVPGRNALQWDIHFWLGSSTSQDEAGVAAYKTVELDELLGGSPVQHRETEGHESNAFCALFKAGIQYKEGGVESGFKHVDRDAYETRLLHLKGARIVRSRQVPLSVDSMNNGDVFVLDMGLTIYQWNGAKANRKEKAKGLDVTQKIKNDERGGKAEIIVLNDGVDDGDAAAFWDALGGKAAVKDASEADDDSAAEKASEAAQKLFRVSDASGELEMSEVEERPLTNKLLDTNDVFILDCDDSLFVWVGRGCTKAEKSAGMKYATDYLTKTGKPMHTRVTRVVENAETPLFKEKFAQWNKPAPTFGVPGAGGNVAKVEQKAIDIAALQQRTDTPAEKMVDDGSGKLEIWRIEDFEKVPVPENLYGQFYGGDSYIVLYTYELNGRENYIIYFWQGLHSSTDEKGASALLAKELDDSMGGAPVQVRVVMNKEPSHFLQLFKGRMVVHEGGKASGFKNREEADSYDTDGISLFHVRGTNALNTRAVQVAEVATSLNSGDAFTLQTVGKQFVWFGVGCNDEERETARSIATILQFDRELVELSEGDEPDEFWEALGGKAEYPSAGALEEEGREPRLFQCSNATGAFTVEEVFNFSQEDLTPDDVYMLDTYKEVYVWVGPESNDKEKKAAVQTAVDYVRNATDGRSADTPVMRVMAGGEPPMFSCHFLGWDAKLAENLMDPYEKKLKELREAQAAAGGDGAAAAAAAPATPEPENLNVAGMSLDGFADPAVTTVPLADLQAGTPDGVNPAKKELYLSDDEFAATFKMSRDDFAALKAWKQKQLKQGAKIF